MRTPPYHDRFEYSFLSKGAKLIYTVDSEGVPLKRGDLCTLSEMGYDSYYQSHFVVVECCGKEYKAAIEVLSHFIIYDKLSTEEQFAFNIGGLDSFINLKE